MPGYKRLKGLIAPFIARTKDATAEYGGTTLATSLNLKLYGSTLARQLLIERIEPLKNMINGPERIGITSKLCTQADFETRWFVHWCQELKIDPVYHRKVWEDCFVLQAIWEAGLMSTGVSAISFGTGQEPIPSLLASKGVDVLATDLSPDSAAGTGWIETSQHSTLDRLHKPYLVDKDTFERRVRLEYADMNQVPERYYGAFDLCWSLCSLEHVGSTEKAFDFVENSVRCLKPGGMAIHTTEFNLSSKGRTITRGRCVLFTEAQILTLCERLRSQGHEVAPVSFDAGSELLDQFVDLPPFPDAELKWTSPNHLGLPQAPHLRLPSQGYLTTSIGLIVRRAGRVENGDPFG